MDLQLSEHRSDISAHRRLPPIIQKSCCEGWSLSVEQELLCFSAASFDKNTEFNEPEFDSMLVPTSFFCSLSACEAFRGWKNCRSDVHRSQKKLTPSGVYFDSLKILKERSGQQSILPLHISSLCYA